MSHAQVWRDMARKLSLEFSIDADTVVIARKIKDKFSNWKKKYTSITKAIQKTGLGDKEKDVLHHLGVCNPHTPALLTVG